MKGQMFLLGCVYRPPKDKNNVWFIHRINIVIVGDTNFDLSSGNTLINTDKSKIQEYKSLLNANNLKNIIKIIPV